MAELSHSFTFVVLRHVRRWVHAPLWRRCVESIGRFHPGVPIVVIDDNSEPRMVQPRRDAPDPPGITCVIQSEYPGAGEILPYHYFLQGRFASRSMIFLHDSMYLKRPLSRQELTSRRMVFLWHFEPNRNRGDVVLEFCRRIGGREGASLLSLYSANRWKGCFGSATIVDIDTLRQWESRYRFVSTLLPVINSRHHREALERIIGVIYAATQPLSQSPSLFGSISLHPHFMNYYREATEDELRGYDSAVVKTWRWR
jgi:hypothetical protein